MRNLSTYFFIGLFCLILFSCKQKTTTLTEIPATLQTNPMSTSRETEEAIKHYKKFMKKKNMYTYTATNAYPRGDSKARYAFGDINGDGVPELHISGAEKYDIYTYQKGKVVLLCDDLGWKYPMITPAKDGAIVVSGRLDEENDEVGRAEYRIPPKDDLFADMGRIDGSIDYYYYLKLDTEGKVITKHSHYYEKEYHKKKGSKQYIYRVDDKKCTKEEWEKKAELCLKIEKDQSKQLAWKYVFPKKEWDYLDAMEEGDGNLENEDDSEEWNFYKRVLSGDFPLLSVDDKCSISSYYTRSLDVFSGRSKWKYILMDFNGDGIKDLFIQFEPDSKNYTDLSYSNVSEDVAFFSYAKGKVDWWLDGSGSVVRIPLRNKKMIQMESYSVTTTLFLHSTPLETDDGSNIEKVYTILYVDLDSYHTKEWYEEHYGNREYKDGDIYYFVCDYTEDPNGVDKELSEEEWEKVNEQMGELLIPDNEWKPASVFLPNRYPTSFSVG